MSEGVVAVDLGGTKTTAALVGARGDVQFERTVSTPADSGPRAVVGRVVGLVRDVVVEAERHSYPTPGLVGIGSAGVIDPASGRVLSATDAITDWAGTDLRSLVAAGTGREVHVLNDVHAHALGEARSGAAEGARMALVVAVGTGVGGAVVVDGAVIAGAHGAAGHVGHVPAPEAVGLTCSCGSEGHLEAVASGPALAALYSRLLLSAGRANALAGSRDARAVVAAFEAGDELAAQAIHVAGTALGRAIGGWMNVLDPDLVILTGGLASSGGHWWRTVCRAAAGELVDHSRTPRIVAPVLGAHAALIGAAAFASGRSPRHAADQGGRCA